MSLKVAVNYRKEPEHQLQVAELLEKAFRETKGVKVVPREIAEQGGADLVVNTLPHNGFIHGAKKSVWWDLETAEFQVNEFFERADAIFYPNSRNIKAYDKYKDKSFFLPLATDPDYFRWYDEPINYEVGFIGREDANRWLRVQGLNELEKFCSDKKYRFLRTNKIDRGEKTSRLTSQCLLNIQIAGLRNIEQRVFETSSMRPLVADRQEENEKDMDAILKPHVHYIPFYYKLENTEAEFALYDWSDLLVQVEYYIKHPAKREQIVRNAREHMFKNHTYRNRVREILEKTGLK